MRREESMDVTGFITKLWKTIFKQKSPAERTTTHPSPAWIRERVHIAIGEEALQSNSDEIYRQWLPSSTPFSSPSPASVGPTKSFPHGKREENEQTHRNRVLEEREHEDMAPGLLIGWLSDPGIKRRYKPNEDSLFAAKGTRLNDTQPQPFGLFIVADGMGGHLYGQEASQLSIQTMVDRLLPTLSSNDRLKKADFRNLLIEGVQMANQVVYQRNQERGTTMGTTLIAALVVEDSAIVANVGDSRAYLHRAGKGLRQITRDHSVVAYLVEQGIIQRGAIYTHPQRNQVYRSLGTESAIAVDTFIEPLQAGDTLFLCSDGLWEMVRDPLIEQILRKTTDPAQTTHALLQAALTGGGADNISEIVVQISETMRAGDVTGLNLLARPDAVKPPGVGHNTVKQSW